MVGVTGVRGGGSGRSDGSMRGENGWSDGSARGEKHHT